MTLLHCTLTVPQAHAQLARALWAELGRQGHDERGVFPERYNQHAQRVFSGKVSDQFVSALSHAALLHSRATERGMDLALDECTELCQVICFQLG